MPDNELDIARELLAKKDLDPKDRATILADFPELDQTSSSVQAPVPTTDELLKGIEDQGPPPFATQNAPILGSANGIKPSEVIAPMSVDEDLSYKALIGRQTSAELDSMDFRPNDPEVRNATKRVSMEPIPEINTESFGMNDVYYHFEPTLEEVKDWARKNGSKEAYDDLEEREEDSNTYKTYADMQWKKVRARFAETGEGAARLKYIDPKTASQWYDATMGNLQGRATSFMGGYDDMFSFGLGKQAAAYAGGKGMLKAEESLVRDGTIRPFADRLEIMKSRYPIEAVAGSVFAMLNPLSAGRAVTGIVKKGAEKAGTKIAKIAEPFVDAALTSGGISSVNKAGSQLRGEESKPWTDIGISTAIDSMIGGSLGLGAEKLYRAGANKVASLREDPIMKETLSRIGMGSPELRGGTTMKPMTGGVKPHKYYKEKSSEIAKEEAKAVINKEKLASNKAPTEEMANDIEWQMRQELASYKSNTTKKIAAMKEPYYESTKNIKVSVEPVGKRIMEMINESSPEGWDLPWSKKEMLEKFLPSMRRKIVNADGTTTYIWRKLNPKEFDDITGDLADALNEEANKTATKTLPRKLSELQGKLNSLRDQFPANEYAPESLVETVMIDGKPTQVRGGLSALNAKAHKMMNSVRNASEAMGLKRIDRLEPDVDSQKKAVIKRIKEWGLSNKSVEDKTLRQLFEGRPDLVEQLDAIASGEAYEAFSKAARAPAGVTGGQGTPRIWMTGSLSRLTGTYLDPLATTLARLEGKGGNVATVSGARDDEYIPAAEQALLGVKDISVKTVDELGTLLKLFNQYKNRGLDKEK